MRFNCEEIKHSRRGAPPVSGTSVARLTVTRAQLTTLLAGQDIAEERSLPHHSLGNQSFRGGDGGDYDGGGGREEHILGKEGREAPHQQPGEYDLSDGSPSSLPGLKRGEFFRNSLLKHILAQNSIQSVQHRDAGSMEISYFKERENSFNRF